MDKISMNIPIPQALQIEIARLFHRDGLLREGQILFLRAYLDEPPELTPEESQRDHNLAKRLRDWLKPKSANALENHGFYFLGQVARKKRGDFNYYRGIGPGTRLELSGLLSRMDLEFGYEGSVGPRERAALATIGK